MIEAQELVELAMKRAKADGPADLARALGLTAYGSPRRVTRWLEGSSDPDYEATMKLLELLEALDLEQVKDLTS